MGEKPVTAQLVDVLLSSQLDALEPRLRRHGCDGANLAELINAGQAEIRSLLGGELKPVRRQGFTARLMAAGLPISTPCHRRKDTFLRSRRSRTRTAGR